MLSKPTSSPELNRTWAEGLGGRCLRRPGPGGAALRGTQIAVGLDHKAYVTVRENGWPDATALPATTKGSPTLAVHGSTLICAIRGDDDCIHASRNSGSGWNSFSPLGNTSAKTLSGPALAADDTGVHLIYRSLA